VTAGWHPGKAQAGTARAKAKFKNPTGGAEATYLQRQRNRISRRNRLVKGGADALIVCTVAAVEEQQVMRLISKQLMLVVKLMSNERQRLEG
jgi:hypothetical protein